MAEMAGADQAVYEKLAQALDALPNGFPRTASGVELAILRRIFSPEEALVGGHLRREADTPEAVALRCGLAESEVAARLKAMAKRGLVWPDFDRATGARRYRLAPFIVGIYEAQLELMDHDLAHLVEDYLAAGGAAGMMGLQPALHRVLPARAAVKTEWILPYDDVVAIVKGAQSFALRDCICRVQQEYVGRRCDFPLRTCLTLSFHRRPARPDDISQDEALAVIDRAEELGLVHTVSNVVTGLYYVCNCCGGCCGILRGITDFGLPNSVARANYVSTINVALCDGCQACLRRCQVGAIRMQGDVAVVERERCIGCGLCVTGCPSEAAQLLPLPDAEAIHPPADFTAWEEERLRHRHLL